MNQAAVNFVAVRLGRIKAICACCGRASPPTQPNEQSEPDLWSMPRNWSQAPYPHDFVHSDGSRGSTFTCPACNKRLRNGESLQRRAYLTGAKA